MAVIKAYKSKESSVAPPGNTLRLPGRKMDGFSFVPLTSRAQEIARGREELLGLLRDLPEPEFELSLTDIVENESVTSSSVSKEKASHEGELNRRKKVVKDKKKIMASKSSFRSRSDGVLLNVYLPISLTRSLTAPRMSKGTVHKAAAECIKRQFNVFNLTL